MSSAIPGGWAGRILTTPQRDRQTIRFAVMPGRLHQQSAGVTVTGLGQPTLDPGRTG
jgi:hypothetical protein